MKQIIEKHFHNMLKELFYKINEHGLNLSIDGIPAYNPKAQFIGGMVINSSCYTVIELLKDAESLHTLTRIISMTAPMEMRTWGILNSLRGIYRLYKNNLLDTVIDKETYNLLKETLDWRTFVDAKNHYALIQKPTNYYGVAFGIARYRELLGWEEESHSIQLLDRYIEHIEAFSGHLGYMDETQGEGRFDRYTIVTPGEITALLLSTGMDVPDKIRKMLRQSCQIALQLANEKGHGFPYGRSSGAYGDTAILEVFSAAAELGGILSDEELELAYAYSIGIMKKIADFWYDKNTGAVNLWDNGRKTDSYRNKNRILSETISICMHVMDSYEHWKKAGFENHIACDDFSEMLEKLNPYTYVTFCDGEYKRGLAIVRAEKHIWTLPIVSGGKQYYHKDAYLPIPFQTEVIEYVPEYSYGQLVPQLILDNGDAYMPLVYTSHITSTLNDNQMTINCEYDGLCLMGQNTPVKLENAKAIVTYTFTKNQIHREDTWILGQMENVKEARLVFLTYSDKPYTNGREVIFENGIIKSIAVTGLEECNLRSVFHDENYNTSHGRITNEIIWSKPISNPIRELKVDWTITY